MTLRLLLIAVVCTLTITGWGQVPKTVTADRTNSTLLWPTNFFAANTNALVSVLAGHFGSGGMPTGTYTNTDSFAALAADLASRTNQNCILWDDFERTVSGTSAMGPSIIGPDLTQYATNWLEHTDASLDGHDYVLTEPWNRYMWSILGAECAAAPASIEASATWTARAASGTTDYIMLGCSPGGITEFATNSLQFRAAANTYALYVYHPAESGGSRILFGWTGYSVSTNVSHTYTLAIGPSGSYAAVLLDGVVLASSTDSRIADVIGPNIYAGNWHITWATPWMSLAVHSLSAWKPSVTPVTLGGTGITNALAFTAVGDGLTNSAGTIKAALAAGTNIVLTTNSGRISINSGAAAGAAPAGTVVTNATGFLQYQLPMMADTSGTNVMPGPLVGDATATNVSVRGSIIGSIGGTNAIILGGNTAFTCAEPAVVISQTWNDGGTTNTYPGTLTINVTNTSSASASRPLNVLVNGSSVLSLTASGGLTTAAGAVVGGNSSIQGSVSAASASSLGWTSRLAMRSDSTTEVQLGADAGTASSFTLKAADGSGTSIKGSSLELGAGQPTGTNYSGDVLVKTYQPRTTSDTTKSTAAITRHEYLAAPFLLTDGAATELFFINLTTNKYVGGTIHYTIDANDGTNYQALSGMATFAAVNKAGTITCTIAEATHAAEVSALSSGTLTDAWSIADDTNDVKIMVNADTSLSGATVTIRYSILLNGNDASVVSPPPAS